jgi:hypothetical protein
MGLDGTVEGASDGLPDGVAEEISSIGDRCGLGLTATLIGHRMEK